MNVPQLPYCLTTYKKRLGNYTPRGTRRYSTVAEALTHASQIGDVNEHMVFVDYAPEFRP